MSQLNKQLKDDQNKNVNNISQQQQIDVTKYELSKVQQQLKQQKAIVKDNKIVYVGTGFTLDLTQFFQFQKNIQLQSGQTLGTIFYQISGGGLSWLVLLYSVFNASFITVWILKSDINKFLALTWRFLFQSILMIPFVLHQKRTISKQKLYQYTFAHIFKRKNIQKLYISSFISILWYAIILSTAQWTYISHALYLGSLVNFFLSLNRLKYNMAHQYQIGGQIIVVIGILFVFIDTLYFRYEAIEPQEKAAKYNYYLMHTKGQRFAADVISIVVSYIVSRYCKITTGMSNIHPPFLNMLLLDIMNFINMAAVAYFFNGVTFDTSAGWGFFSMFKDYQFAVFLYSGIVLCVGLVISFVLVAKLFPNFVAPSIAYFCQPALSTLLLNFTGVQSLPHSFSLIGYVFMTPGMGLILLGQWIFVRNKKRQQLLNSLKLIQLQQINSEKSDHALAENEKIHSYQY